jgi:BirA family biotin operon repressor/biotin-[acetyl-CoA-carboxylase] ligase
VALGVAGCLDRHGITARTKWPNDVVVEGRKIAGILPELGSMGGWKGPRSVVVGVGLNVGLSAAEAAQIDQPATSVFIEKGAAPSPRELLPELLQQIAPWIERWERGGFEALRQDWLQCCAGLGQPVTIVDGDHRRSGTLAGFGADGQLQLDEGAAIRDVWAGHLLLTPD